jgi:hypothetical protein
MKISLKIALFVILLLLVFFAFCSPKALGQDRAAPGQKTNCDFAEVIWRDAALYTGQGGLDPATIDDLTKVKLSIGCVRQTEKTVVVVVFTLTQGKPETFLIIPKDQVTAIVVLTPETGKPEGKKENSRSTS